MRPVAKRSLGYVELFRHVPVMLDLLASFVRVVVQNQISLPDRQALQTMVEAVELVAFIRFKIHADINELARKLFPPVVLANDVSRDTVKIVCGLTDETILDVRQSLCDAINGFVGKIFSIVEAFGNKYSDQARVNGLVLSSGKVAVRV